MYVFSKDLSSMFNKWTLTCETRTVEKLEKVSAFMVAGIYVVNVDVCP